MIGANQQRAHKLWNTLKTGCWNFILDWNGPVRPESARSNNTNNSIDGIWVTPEISTTTGGYDQLHLRFDSYHYLLRIKLSYETNLVNIMSLLRKPIARDLQMDDMRGKSIYHIVVKHISKNYTNTQITNGKLLS